MGRMRRGRKGKPFMQMEYSECHTWHGMTIHRLFPTAYSRQQSFLNDENQDVSVFSVAQGFQNYGRRAGKPGSILRVGKHEQIKAQERNRKRLDIPRGT